jgi:exosortase D (VPLPA-CTERM-specific)
MNAPLNTGSPEIDMTSTSPAQGKIWRLSLWAWASILGSVALICVISFDSLRYMVNLWSSKEEYGYAYIVPIVVLFMIWQKRETLERLPFDGSWAGTAVVLLGLGLSLLGEFGTIYVVVQYAVLVVLAGLALTFMGWRGLKEIWAPLLLLAFMIPLPDFLYRSVSAESQLISSQLGVAIIKLLGISVFLDGNVIDLGSYKLQVAEACNGLRYLFPLMTLGFIAAYFFVGAWWKRAIIFLSTIPITILMNSFRIGVIGIMVEHWGRSMAEGFLHDFEGWVIFMACTAVLVGEMWLLARIGSQRHSLRDVFAIEFPARAAPDTPVQFRSVPKPFVGALLMLVFSTVMVATLPSRAESPLQRKDFSQFPMTLGKWQGKPNRMEAIYMDVLKLDDYVLADFIATDRRPVNFYVAYYASQRKGESAHSPRSCIPGGGWEITDLTQHSVDGATVAGRPLWVNRVVIQKGDDEQLVYYWFQQRGRVVTNEYLVKWYLFWDALTRNRTDGALVRVMTNVNPGRNLAEADIRLSSFASSAAAQLEDYIPD